jgi:glyoxylase-like metal-dependent hydrolase (beta-lactamase superfamily II)
LSLPGVHTIQIPAPYAVNSINVYFIELPCPTLIDVPPDDLVFREHLGRALEQKGYSFRDIRRIIVTHPHFDHYGLASWIVEQSGAEVWAFGGGALYFETFPDQFEADFLHYAVLLENAGAPHKGNTYLDEFYKSLLRLGCKVKISRYLKDGDTIQLGSTPFTVVHVPGHTPWCIMIYDRHGQIAFTGDFLIKDISSNALLQRPGMGLYEYKSLKTHVLSLQKTKALGLETALPGHGKPIRDAGRRIDQILHSIEGRKKQILALVNRLGPCTPFELMTRLFPDLPDWQVLLGMSEIIGHLELLEEEGLVQRERKSYIFSTPSPLPKNVA